MANKSMRGPSTPALEVDGPPAIQRRPVSRLKPVEVVPARVNEDGVILRSAVTAMVPDQDAPPLREALTEQADWKDPTDTGTGARMRGARVIDGHRVVWQVARLHKSSPNEITSAHVTAAERLLNDWNVRNGRIRSQLGHSQGGGDTPIVNAAVRAGKAMDAAATALGPSLMRILNIVVINNRPITALATALGVHRDRAHGRFAAAIERLREHYQPVTKPRAANPAPAPLPDMDDISSERFGRWRKAGEA